MLLNQHAKNAFWRIANKEWSGFFFSPIAYLFLLVFSGVTLFVFFWVDAFYARNVADISPLFKAMPILFVFLCSALTMKSWSEERRAGTLEHVFTQPVPLAVFVLGKFFGSLAVLLVALVITLPIPLSVWLMAGLDWGPVIAGYLASLVLGASYLAIGQFASSRTDNQIVSLIVSVLICSAFYFIGSEQVTSFFGQSVQSFLGGLSTSVRFEDITRGVIDLRDLYYFVSLIAVFLTCTVFGLERERWISNADEPHHVHWRWATVLLVANLLTANLWLNYFNAARIDTTAGQQYSLTDTTRHYLENLKEPLLIRGYFSDKTHPLLAPLVPQLKNLLQEYDVASRKVNVELVDPLEEPEIEQEAREKYSIESVPFQLSDRYQSSIVSSYFNILVQYGDEYVVLDFDDLIDVRSAPDGDVEVALRNAEFDVTKSIKTVIQRFQTAGNIFDTINSDLTFTAYVSADEHLPEELQTYREALQPVLDEFVDASDNKLAVEWIAPEEQGDSFEQELAANYGFRPMATSLLDDQSFYFYMVLGTADQKVQIPLGDLTADLFRQNIEAGLQRFSTGFTRTLAMVTPDQQNSGYGQSMMSVSPSFNQLESWLGAEWNIVHEDLSDGRVSGEADALWVLAPEQLSTKEVFAIDQYLMQGGSVFLATSPYNATLQNRTLRAQNYSSGLTEWLAHNGIEIDSSLIMDERSSTYPVPVTRNIAGLSIQDIRLLPYPYFLDARDDGLNQDHPMLSGLPQLNVSWASPIHVTESLPAEVTATQLVRSSTRAELSDSLIVTPSSTDQSFAPVNATGEAYVLATALEGTFTSYFSDEDSPTLSFDTEGDDEDEDSFDITQVIEKSPASSKLVIFASNSFLSDQVLQLSKAVNPSLSVNNLTFASNAVDWSLEDAGLMSIRSRGTYSQVLPPMTEAQQKAWEYGNYIMALILIVGTGAFALQLRRRKQKRWAEFLSAENGGVA